MADESNVDMIRIIYLPSSSSLLLQYQQARLLSFDRFKFFQDILRDFWLCNTNSNDLNASIPLVAAVLKSFGKGLVQNLKVVNVHFAKGVTAAELVDLMMNFIKDPDLVIPDTVVTHSWIYMCAIQLKRRGEERKKGGDKEIIERVLSRE